MNADELIRGWPFTERMPLRIGEVDHIAWAIAEGGPDTNPTINGYARIPWEGHPWSGCTDYDTLEVRVHGGLTYGPHPPKDMQALVESLEAATAGTDHPFTFSGRTLPTYPGVTFKECGGWIGFDTGHAGDYWSDEELALWNIRAAPGYRLPAIFEPGRHWTGRAVIAEARRLAAQIAEAGRWGE